MSNYDSNSATGSNVELPVLPLYLVTDRSQSMGCLSEGYSNFHLTFRNQYIERLDIGTRVALTTVGFDDEYRMGADFADMTKAWLVKYPFDLWGFTKSYREGLMGLMNVLNYHAEKVRLYPRPVMGPLAFFVTCAGRVEDDWSEALGLLRARESWCPQVACFFFDGDEDNLREAAAAGSAGQAGLMMQSLVTPPHFYPYSDASELFSGLLSSLTLSIEASVVGGSAVIVPPAVGGVRRG